MKKHFKARLFKKSVISIGTLSTIAGATTGAVVVINDNINPPEESAAKLNQPKYDSAVKSLKVKLDKLPIFSIMHGAASDNTKMDQFKASIEKEINSLITGELKSVLSHATVVIPARTIDTDNVVNNLISGNLTLTIKSSVEVLTQAAPINFKIKYNVVNNDQDNYNEAVKTIVDTLDNLTVIQNTFLDGTPLAKVKEALVDKINHAIGDSNQYISKFAAATLDTVLTTPATNIETQITAQTRTDLSESITGLIFQSKKSVTGTPQSFTFKYKIIETQQEHYEHQLKALLDKFTTTGTGTITTGITKGWTKAEVEAELTKLLAKEITAGGASYALLNKANISFTGITDKTFGTILAGDHSTAAKDLTTGIKITVGTTDNTGSVTPAENAFQFYYSINPSTADGTTYTNALSSIATYFGAKTLTTPTNPLTLALNEAAGDGWKTSVIGTLRAAILTYVNTNFAGVFDTGTAGANIDIVIGGSNFVNNVVSVAKLSTNSITFTIPSKWTGTGTAGITTAQKIPIVIGYTVPVTQSLVDSAAKKIQTWFNTAANAMTIDRLGYYDTADGKTSPADQWIADTINTWKNGATSTLSNNEKASIRNLTKADVTHFTSVDNSAVTASTVHATSINLVIGKSTAAGTGVNDYTFKDNFEIYFNIVANARDKAAQAVLDTAIASIITESGQAANPVVLTLYKGADAATVETAIKELISNKLIGTTGASDWLKTAVANVTVTGVVTTGVPADITVNTAAVTTGTLTAGIKATVAVSDSKSATTNVTAVSLTGLHFEVVLSKQQIWQKQAEAIITAAQTAQATTPISLLKSDDVDAIKTKVVKSINTEITNAAAANKTLLTTAIAATNVNLALTNFDISSSTTTSPRTSSATPNAVKITIPAATGTLPKDVTPVEIEISIKYEVHTTNQDDYDSAMTAILDHFKTTELFSGKTTEMGDGTKHATTGIKAAIVTKIQKSIYTYWNQASTVAGALTSAQKAALTPNANGANITVEFVGTLDHATPIDTHTTASNNVKITITAADGATAAAKLFTGARYSVVYPWTQKDYDDAMSGISNYFQQAAASSYYLRPNIFSTKVSEMGDGTNGSGGFTAALKAQIQKNIYDYIKTYSGTGALTADQKSSLGDLGTNGANITVTVKGTFARTEVTDASTTAGNNITIHIAAASGLTAADKDLTGARYSVLDPQKKYDALAKAIANAYNDALNESYLGNWTLDTATGASFHRNAPPSFKPNATYTKAEFDRIIAAEWIPFLKSPNGIKLRGGPVRDAFIFLIEQYAAKYGDYKLELKDASCTLTNWTRIDVILSFSPWEAGINPKSFIPEIVIEVL